MILTKKEKDKKVLASPPADQNSVKPFIRWAGGKQNLVKKLSENLPRTPFKKYFEPFVGAGSLFLFNDFDNSFISDINPHLINSYSSIKESAEKVFDRLEFHRKKLSEKYYYKLRKEFNLKKEEYDIKQAATFIFLVHTSFNGIFRVNKKGEYNVPFGKPNPALPSKDHLLKIKDKLSNTVIENCMYEDILDTVSPNDFVYFDPPYPPLTELLFSNIIQLTNFRINSKKS